MTRNGVVLAETSRPVLLVGGVYFAPEDARHEFRRCPALRRPQARRQPRARETLSGRVG